MKLRMFICFVLSVIVFIGTVGISYAVTNQTRTPITLGFQGNTSASGGTTTSLNASGTWLALSFVPSDGRTLSTIAIYNETTTGTQSLVGVSCDLYSDSSVGTPNTSIESKSIAVGSWVASGTWATFTGFTTALTAGVRYWIVFKNISASPTVDYPRLFQGNSSSMPIFASSGSNVWGWARVGTVDSGTTWATTPQPGNAGMLVGYSDSGGSYDGIPISSHGPGAVGIGVYSTRESGNIFTTPASVSFNVRGLSFFVSVSGTPTGSVVFKLYTGTTLTATTATIPVGNSTGGAVTAYFSTTQTLSPSTSYRVVIAETTQSDASGNRYNGYLYTFKNDSNFLSTLPFSGTLQQTYYNGSAWVETSNTAMSFSLLLDTDTPFAAASTGGTGLLHGTVVH